MNLKMLKAALAGLVLSVSGIANAGLIYNVDSGWQDFTWEGGVGTTSDQGGFTFELATEGLLTVVDAFAFGDEFEIWLNGSFNSVTSDVALYAPINVGGDADLAISSDFSQGTVALAAGSYSVDFKLFQNGVASVDGPPFDGGKAFFKVETTSVPEPSTLAIFALGVLGLASRRVKK